MNATKCNEESEWEKQNEIKSEDSIEGRRFVVKIHSLKWLLFVVWKLLFCLFQLSRFTRSLNTLSFDAWDGIYTQFFVCVKISNSKQWQLFHVRQLLCLQFHQTSDCSFESITWNWFHCRFFLSLLSPEMHFLFASFLFVASIQMDRFKRSFDGCN